MPRLSQPTTTQVPVEFVVSPALDLLNAMYFTALSGMAEGIEDWPAQVLSEMDPELRAELEFLYTFPKGQPGVMGTLGDRIWAHREAWQDIDSLISFVRSLPLGVGNPPQDMGIQGLAFYTACSPLGISDEIDTTTDPRSALAQTIESDGSDVEAALAVYDRPEELRSRMVTLIERFYQDHYRHDMPRRLACLERSANSHGARPVTDIVELARKLTGRPVTCLEEVCTGPHDALMFAPSLDMGPYYSCAAAGRVHGMFYPCEPEFLGESAEEAQNTSRLARVHKALGDEQRLRILNLLRDREMYAQEIVEITGLHQSVISRHLSFMTAVGLLIPRREGNMKFFRLNPDMQDELARTLSLFAPAQS